MENCLFGLVNLTKDNDIDKYEYLGYGIEFDSKGSFVFLDGDFSQNLPIFGVDMSSFVHANNNTKVILIFGQGLTQGLEDTMLYAKKKYSNNFT